MPSLEELLKIKKSLKNTVTNVTREDGTEIQESRGLDGSFVDNQESEQCDASTSDDVSNRRRKKVEHARRYGFVIDLKPDLQIASCCDGLYLGSQDGANDFESLKREGITHVVNCATGVANFYPRNFRYCSPGLLDLPTTNIKDYFPTIHDFIRNAIYKGGKVFVHCNAGISRAPTIVLSYLMSEYEMSLQEAMETIKKERPGIRPNVGFMQQLHAYEDELKVQRAAEDYKPPQDMYP